MELWGEPQAVWTLECGEMSCVRGNKCMAGSVSSGKPGCPLGQKGWEGLGKAHMFSICFPGIPSTLITTALLCCIAVNFPKWTDYLPLRSCPHLTSHAKNLVPLETSAFLFWPQVLLGERKVPGWSCQLIRLTTNGLSTEEEAP